MPTDALERLAAERDIDDTGWAVLVAHLHGLDVDLVTDVLNGRRSTMAVDEELAAAVLTRRRDPALVDPDDRRDRVLVAARSFVDDDVCDAGADIGRVLVELEAHTSTTAAHVAYGVGRAADHLRGLIGAERFAAAIIAIIAENRIDGIDTTIYGPNHLLADTLLNRHRETSAALADRLADMAPITRDAFTAVIVHRSPNLADGRIASADIASAWRSANAAHGQHSADILTAARDDSLRLGAHLGELSTAYVGAGAALHGPGSLAELWGLPADLDDLDADDAQHLIAAAPAGELGDAAIVAFLDTWSDHGRRTRPIPHQQLTAPNRLAGIRWQTALATADLAGNTTHRLADNVVTWCDTLGDDADEFLDALRGRRHDLYDDMLVGLPSALNRSRSRPQSLEGAIADSTRKLGLATWVAIDGHTRRALLTAATGIGTSRWKALAALLPTFNGSPDELVAVTAEVAPAA